MASLETRARQQPNRVEHAIARLAGLCFARPWIALALLTVSTLLSIQTARNLKLDADIIALLPESFQSVQDLEKLKKRYGGAGTITVFAGGAQPTELERFARELAPKLEALETIRYVTFERPNKYFQDRGLYYLDEADLVSLRDQLKARYDWERLNANPLYLDLVGDSDQEPPEFDLTTIESLQHKYVGGSAKSAIRREQSSKYYLDETTQSIAVMARPNGLASDLNFTARVVADVEAAIAQLDYQSYAPNLNVELTGRYKKRLDLQALAAHDIKLASILAATLMLVYLGFHFRRALAVLLILTPLFVGLSWTFAFATLTFGSLNILTGLIGAVLLGLGIDHGIHLLSGYECAVAEGQSAADALFHTFSQTGRAVLFAALTTGVGFSGPALSELRAFHEFGAIAAAGMVFIVLSYLTLLPTLLGLAHRLGWQPSASNADSADRPNRIGLTHGRPAMALSVIALVLVLLGLRHTSFNYDFSGLEGGTHLRSVILNDEVTRVLGHSTSPILVLADDAADAQRIAASLRANQERLGPHSTIDFIATRADVVPPNQRAKAAIIAEIYAVTKKVRGRSLPRSLRKKLRKLKVMAAQQPFTMKDVPRGVQQQFETRDGSPADGFLLVYPRVALDQGLLVQKLARELRSVPMPNGKTISVASESMVLADILTMVFQEGPRVLSVTLVAVFFTVLILLRSWRDTFLALSPATLTLILTAGLLPMVDVQFDYLNIIMIPVLFGLGVDGGIHIVTKLRSSGSLQYALQKTGPAITGALFTSALGFAAMFSTQHSGLRSLAALSLIGLAANLLSCMVGLPSIIRFRRAKTKT